jgi:hypothetical protein
VRYAAAPLKAAMIVSTAAVGGMLLLPQAAIATLVGDASRGQQQQQKQGLLLARRGAGAGRRADTQVTGLPSGVIIAHAGELCGLHKLPSGQLLCCCVCSRSTCGGHTFRSRDCLPTCLSSYTVGDHYLDDSNAGAAQRPGQPAYVSRRTVWSLWQVVPEAACARLAYLKPPSTAQIVRRGMSDAPLGYVSFAFLYIQVCMSKLLETHGHGLLSSCSRHPFCLLTKQEALRLDCLRPLMFTSALPLRVPAPQHCAFTQGAQQLLAEESLLARDALQALQAIVLAEAMQYGAYIVEAADSYILAGMIMNELEAFLDLSCNMYALEGSQVTATLCQNPQCKHAQAHV